MLRMAVLGVGWAGTRHVRAVRELGRKIAVDCLVDCDAPFLAEKAQELGIRKTYIDYADALSDPAVDAVSICLPHNLHCEAAVAAAGAGKHILCEKPMALTVADATRMIETAEAHGVILYVAENAAYTPMAKFLRHVVSSGEIVGEVTGASMVKGFQALDYGYAGRRAWLSTPEEGGTGTWMLHGVHSVAQLRSIFGEVATVYLREHRIDAFQRDDLEGTMSGLLTMVSGVHISIVQTCETHLRPEMKGYTIYGEQASLRVSREGYQVLAKAHEPVWIKYPAEALSPYAREMAAFADTVAGRSIGPTTGRSERRSLAVVQAGYESARTGRPVDLKDRFGEL